MIIRDRDHLRRLLLTVASELADDLNDDDHRAELAPVSHVTVITEAAEALGELLVTNNDLKTRLDGALKANDVLTNVHNLDKITAERDGLRRRVGDVERTADYVSQHLVEARGALADLVDGQTVESIQHATGLPRERCHAILDIVRRSDIPGVQP